MWIKKKFKQKVFFVIKKAYRKFCKNFKFFRDIDKILVEIRKSIILFSYTKEWLMLSKEKFCFTEVDGIKYPTVETIKDLHDFLVIKYQKDIDKIQTGDISLAPLDFTGIKYWMEKDSNQIEDIIIRGAHIFNKFLEEGHPFVDGNKRTGWATLWLFLTANGIMFFFPNNFHKNENVEKIKQWAGYKEESTNIPEIIQWIKKYYKKNK